MVGVDGLRCGLRVVLSGAVGPLRPRVWCSPTGCWLKLNVDMACHLDKPNVGLGAIIRNDWGALIVAQASVWLGFFAVEAGKILTMFEGLRLVEACGYANVWVE